MRVGLHFKKVGQTLFINKDSHKTDIDIKSNIKSINPSKIILYDIVEEDLLWFEALLSVVPKPKCRAISFQGNSICKQAYDMIDALRIQQPDIGVSFSVGIATNTRFLRDDDALASICYNPDDSEEVYVYHFNMKDTSYGEFKRIIPKAEAIKREIDSKMLSTPLQKVLYVDNWMQKHIQYIKSGSFDELGEHFEYPQVTDEAVVTDVLTRHYGVCEDISASVATIMNLLGVDTEVVGSGNHAWNVIRIGGEWYVWDCTRNITRNENKVPKELKATKYGRNFLLRGSNWPEFDDNKYIKYGALYEAVSEDDYPRSEIEDCISEMTRKGLIKTSYGENIVYKNMYSVGPKEEI